MRVNHDGWESGDFDPSVSQVLKYGFYVPYGYNQWVILDEYIFWSRRLQKAIIVPRWFLTDLSSIPKGFRWLISVNEPHRDAALPHDVWYAFGKELGWIKSEGDKMFRDFLIVSNISKLKRQTMYKAVSWFGSSSWNAKKTRFVADNKKQEYIDRYSHLFDLSFENGTVEI